MSAIQFDRLLIPMCGIQFCRINYRLKVRHDTGIYRLVVLDFGGVQSVLALQSLEKLENLLFYNFHF